MTVRMLFVQRVRIHARPARELQCCVRPAQQVLSERFSQTTPAPATTDNMVRYKLNNIYKLI